MLKRSIKPFFIGFRLNSVSVVKGRLRETIVFWRNTGASRWLWEALRESYCLPFFELPDVQFLPNQRSATANKEFVAQQISELLASGDLVETRPEELSMCSPLGVVKKSAGKARLIVDLRYVNKHLSFRKFKYEDIRAAVGILENADWFILNSITTMVVTIST